MVWMPFLAALCRWGNWGTGRWRNLLTLAYLVNGRDQTLTLPALHMADTKLGPLHTHLTTQTTPIWQMRKQRLREAKQLARWHKSWSSTVRIWSFLFTWPASYESQSRREMRKAEWSWATGGWERRSPSNCLLEGALGRLLGSLIFWFKV